MQLEDIKKHILQCTKCDLYKDKLNYVVGEGDSKATIVFIGEAPGAQEDKQGRPFIGRAGEVLSDLLASIDLERADIYIMNILKCFIDGQVNIFTSKGKKQIKDIKKGDLVLTHKGRFKRVIATLDDYNPLTYSGNYIKIWFSYKGYKKDVKNFISVTPEHELLTDKGWKKASDIIINDKLKILSKECKICGALFPYMTEKDVCSVNCAGKRNLGRKLGPLSEECKQKIRLATIGEKNHFFGKHHTTQTRIKISQDNFKRYDDNPQLKYSITKNANDLTRQKIKNKTFYLTSEFVKKNHWTKKYDDFFVNMINIEIGQKVKDQNIKSGHMKKLAKIGTQALKTFYKNNIHQSGLINIHKGTRLEKIMRWALFKEGITDFICNEKITINGKRFYPDIKINNICIECDGIYWHNEKNKEKDIQRDKVLEQNGYKVLRFTEEKIKSNVFDCVTEIKRVMANDNHEYKFNDVDIINIEIKKLARPKHLYDITVEDDESFIAKGIVSHNCRPLNNREPKENEILACTPYLDKQLEIINPKIICTLGNYSSRYIFKKYGKEKEFTSITKVRGKVFTINTINGTIKIIPLLHPAMALYNPEVKKSMLEDIKQLK